MSLKKQILDKIVIVPEQMDIGNPKVLSAAANCDLSVLFTNVLKLDDDIDTPDDLSYLNHLVFEDLLVLFDSQNPKDGSVIKDGAVARIYRINSTTVGLTLFQRAMDGDNYVLFANYWLEYDHHTHDFKCQFGLNSLKDKLRGEFVREYYVLLLGVIYKLQCFERIVKHDPRTSLKLRRLNFQQKASYIEYTIDLSKPVTLSADSKGGHHASPREHLRRGHYRTSKLGRRYFVKASVVNKGSKAGKIVKAYNLGEDTHGNH